MIKKIIFLFLVLSTINLFSFKGDSLKLNRHLLEINYGEAKKQGFIPENVSPNYSLYHFSKIKTVYFGYSFCLNPRTKKPFSLFYIQAGVKYLQLSFTRTLLDVREQTKTGYRKFTYDPLKNTVNYHANSLLISLNLQHDITLFHHLIITQKIGINFINILDKDRLYEHKRLTESSILVSDPSSPTGYNVHYYNEVEMIKEGLPIPFRNGIAPFYSFGLGCKIKNLTPFISTDIMGFGGKTILNFQAGMKFNFKQAHFH